MRPILPLLLFALVACSPSDSTPEPTPATRQSCGPMPDPPLSTAKCFPGWDFEKYEIQTWNPRGPNYVPPGCPCAPYIGFATPDGGWTQ